MTKCVKNVVKRIGKGEGWINTGIENKGETEEGGETKCKTDQGRESLVNTAQQRHRGN